MPLLFLYQEMLRNHPVVNIHVPWPLAWKWTDGSVDAMRRPIRLVFVLPDIHPASRQGSGACVVGLGTALGGCNRLGRREGKVKEGFFLG